MRSQTHYQHQAYKMKSCQHIDQQVVPKMEQSFYTAHTILQNSQLQRVIEKLYL